MNVIVSNKCKEMLEALDIEVMKSVNGEFEVDQIINEFSNFFYQRMILDITAIKDYKDIKNIQKLSISLDMNKIILLLDDSNECNSPEYLSKLVSIGIYNFTKNLEGIMYLYNTPNTYRDVAHIQQLDTVQPQVVEYVPIASDINAKVPTPTAMNKIIGIKSVTKEAGATTLAYLMKRELSNNYDVAAIEIDKRDFMFFKDKDLYSMSAQEVSGFLLKNQQYQAVIIDLNNNPAAENVCNEIIYLIEPSIIKLNKMMLTGAKTLKELSGKIIVLNKSLLSHSDVNDFQKESGLKIFFNLPPVNDREKGNQDINKLLVNLGFSKQKVK